MYLLAFWGNSEVPEYISGNGSQCKSKILSSIDKINKCTWFQPVILLVIVHKTKNHQNYDHAFFSNLTRSEPFLKKKGMMRVLNLTASVLVAKAFPEACKRDQSHRIVKVERRPQEII